MTNKFVKLALPAALAVVLILLISWQFGRGASEEKQAFEAPNAAAGLVQLANGSGGAADSPAEGDWRFPPLQVQATPTERGFQLSFADDQHPIASGNVSTPTHDVHLFARDFLAEEGNGGNWMRYDAVVVRPETREVQAYPLYELNLLLPGGQLAPELTEDGGLLFVRPSLDGGKLTYDLAKLYIGSGRFDAIAPRFWELQVVEGETPKDYLLSSHYENGMLMLTSYEGRIWRFDAESGKVRTNGDSVYPAYGDLGSTPPRELVYPSPDLTRLVYQPEGGQRFEVIASGMEGEQAVGRFAFDAKTALMAPGIVWSPDSRMFFIEFGRADQALGVYTDNGMLLYGQGIRFYDRDGQAVRTLELPEDREKRMNVYGWSEEGKIWIEYFRPGEPMKKDVSYKLYNVEQGTLTDYKAVQDLSKLGDIQVVKRHDGYSFRSLPFLLVDRKARLVYQPPKDALALREGKQSYMQLPSEGGSLVYRWEAAKRSWQWIDSDSGEERQGERVYAQPSVSQDRWLVYGRRIAARIDYVSIDKPLPRNADGLPLFPGKFDERQELKDWWNDDRRAAAADGPALRASGQSKYGVMKIVSLPGEAEMKEGGGVRYYGTYSATFTNRQGVVTTLEPLADLALHQELSPSSIEVHSFAGYDLLLFQLDSFRFSRSFDGGEGRIMAFAATERGEFYPLTFQYAAGEGLQSLSAFPINASQPIESDGEQLRLHAWVGHEAYELALKPSLEQRALIVADEADREAETAFLAEITRQYAGRLEQALGLEEGSYSEEKLDDKHLRALFSDQAWSNPGFQHLRRDFAESKRKGSSSRAFAWMPIEARFVSPDQIRFTFTLNLWYAIGLAAHLEAGLKLENGVWTIRDLGTLETEKLEGLPGYNGLLIENPLTFD